MNNYSRLINDVKKVDRIAALRLARELPLLQARKQIEINADANYISGAFLWSYSRQPIRYWADIDYKHQHKLPS